MNATLLRRLREASGTHVPFETLTTFSNDPHRDLDELQAFGFTLERHPRLGVAYRGPSERLCPDQIEEQLGDCFIGRRVAVWNRVVSTNDHAALASNSLTNEGLVVLAEEQTAGRGRRGRSWIAPARTSILMSVLIFPEGSLADPSWLTALGAVAVAELVRERTGADARIKWPNDVRVDGKKLSGVLVERGAAAVIGIGLNVNLDHDDFPPELTGSVTSMRILQGERVDRSDLAASLIQRLDALYRQAKAVGPEPLRLAWSDLSEHTGRDARVVTRTGVLRGRVTRIDLFEGVTLRSTDGATHELPRAEVASITTL
ncbi:MAG: biotin--[acetyl-CoA-carboxylase] ligase [Isosphaeraceae bacterium]